MNGKSDPHAESEASSAPDFVGAWVVGCVGAAAHHCRITETVCRERKHPVAALPRCCDDDAPI